MERILFFFLALAAFLSPGYWWATWLHRRDDYRWWLRGTLGFVWSFALFDLVGGPFLWFGGSFHAFAWTLACVWAVFSPLSFWLGRRGRVQGEEKTLAGTPPWAFSTDTDAPAVPGTFWAAIAAYSAMCALVLYLWSGHDLAMQVKLLALAPLVVLVGCGLLLPFRSKLAPLLAFTSADDQPPPKTWTAIAVGMILWQAAGSAVYFRPDWDDCYYLGAVLDYEHSPSLNDRDPTTREMIGVNAPHRAMCLELWGAVLCRLTGTDPQTLFHSLLPAPFVLLSYAAYAALFGQVLPRKWVPLALVGLSGYFFWGIGEQFGAANHFLIRIWQGKAILLHLALPLAAALLIQFSQQVAARIWLSLAAAVCCGLGFTSSAVFLGTAAVSCLALALLPGMRSGRTRFLLLAAAVCLPLVVEGLAIMNDSRSELTTSVAMPADADKAASREEERSPQLAWALLMLDMCARRGSAEILWLLSLPIAALLLLDLRRWAYAIWFPVIFLSTFGNPFLALWIAEHITSQEGYYRLFWLFPVGPGLALVFALLGRFCRQLIPSRSAWRGVAFPLAATLAGVLLLAVLPGKFVWSPANRFDAYMFPRIGGNLEKMSPDLLEIVRILDGDPQIDRGTVLCGEEVTSHLIPWSSRYKYVMVRAMYLPGYGLDPAFEDGSKRFFLICVLQCGRYAERYFQARMLLSHTRPIPAEVLIGTVPLPEPKSDLLPRLSEVPDILDQYRVDYMITSPPLWLAGAARQEFGKRLMADRDETLRQLGFRQAYAGREHSLWQRVRDER